MQSARGWPVSFTAGRMGSTLQLVGTPWAKGGSWRRECLRTKASARVRKRVSRLRRRRTRGLYRRGARWVAGGQEMGLPRAAMFLTSFRDVAREAEEAEAAEGV